MHFTNAKRESERKKSQKAIEERLKEEREERREKKREKRGKKREKEERSARHFAAIGSPRLSRDFHVRPLRLVVRRNFSVTSSGGVFAARSRAYTRTQKHTCAGSLAHSHPYTHICKYAFARARSLARSLARTLTHSREKHNPDSVGARTRVIGR